LITLIIKRTKNFAYQIFYSNLIGLMWFHTNNLSNLAWKN